MVYTLINGMPILWLDGHTVAYRETLPRFSLIFLDTSGF